MPETTTTIIGPFSLSLQSDGTVELRTFAAIDRHTLSAAEAFDLLQWLYNQRDALFQAVHPEVRRNDSLVYLVDKWTAEHPETEQQEES